MFVGTTGSKIAAFDLVVVPLKGTALDGRWGTSTDLLLLCHIQSGKFCICRPGDHPSRFEEKLGMSELDAEYLATWVEETFSA